MFYGNIENLNNYNQNNDNFNNSEKMSLDEVFNANEDNLSKYNFLNGFNYLVDKQIYIDYRWIFYNDFISLDIKGI
jgi:hypothetical protein